MLIAIWEFACMCKSCISDEFMKPSIGKPANEPEKLFQHFLIKYIDMPKLKGLKCDARDIAT